MRNPDWRIYYILVIFGDSPNFSRINQNCVVELKFKIPHVDKLGQLRRTDCRPQFMWFKSNCRPQFM